MSGGPVRLKPRNRIRQINRTIDQDIIPRYKELSNEFGDIQTLIAEDPTRDYTTSLENTLESIVLLLNEFEDVLDEQTDLTKLFDPGAHQDLWNKLESNETLEEEYINNYNEMVRFYHMYPRMLIKVEGGYVFPPLETENPFKPQQVASITNYPLVVDKLSDLTGMDATLPCFCYTPDGQDEADTSLCRIDCGHVAHCSCINYLLNTRLSTGERTNLVTSISNTGEPIPVDIDIFGGWSSACPKCRKKITQVAKCELPVGNELSFGKTKTAKMVRTVNMEISYLKK